MVFSTTMGNLRSCRVTFKDPGHLEHSVEVMAESLYEAAVLAIKAFKSQDWGLPPGRATRLQIEVLQPVVRHELSVGKLQDWLSSTGSPRDVIQKARLRELLSEESNSA